MGVRFPSVASTAIANALPATAAETVICVTPPLTIPLDFAQIFLSWMAAIQSQTGTTTLQMRIRRGITTAGALVGAALWSQQSGAGNNALMSGFYVDTPGAVGGQQYCLTCAQNTATVAGTVADVSLIAFVL